MVSKAHTHADVPENKAFITRMMRILVYAGLYKSISYDSYEL